MFMLHKCGTRYDSSREVRAAHLLRGLAESGAWLAPDAPTQADMDMARSKPTHRRVRYIMRLEKLSSCMGNGMYSCKGLSYKHI